MNRNLRKVGSFMKVPKVFNSIQGLGETGRNMMNSVGNLSTKDIGENIGHWVAGQTIAAKKAGAALRKGNLGDAYRHTTDFQRLSMLGGAFATGYATTSLLTDD